MRRSKSNNKKNIKLIQTIITSAIMLILMGVSYINNNFSNNENISTAANYNNIVDVPEYSSSPYVEINNNIPYFNEQDYTRESFEKYSKWDNLGRSGVAYANVCKETMPKEGEERGEIGNIKDLSRMGTKKI